MKRRASCLVVCGLLLAAMLVTGVASPRAGGGSGPVGQASLDAVEVGALVYIREEEKLARDVYEALYKVWPLEVFARIAASEQSHMDAVLKMLVKYEIPDPAEGMGPGEFTELSGLQALYDELVGGGTESKVQALEAGVFIEETDITDLESAIGQTDNPDLQQVYGNLLEGSERHLEAFNRHLNNVQIVPTAE